MAARLACAFPDLEEFLGTTPLHRQLCKCRLKAVRRLARRGSRTLCLAEGARSVRAAFAAGACVQEQYVAYTGGIAIALNVAVAAGVPLCEAARARLRSPAGAV